MTGPTSTHSDRNPVSGMAVTPSASEERTGQPGPASYQRLLSLGNLILFNDELDSGTLLEPRCSRCGSGVPTCAEVGIPHAEASAAGGEVTALDYDVARNVLAALKAARIAVVELAETQTDPEYGDEFWQVPSSDYNYPGKLRIETGYRDGVPRISMTSIRTPMPTTEVDAYVSALLAAKAAAEVYQ